MMKTATKRTRLLGMILWLMLSQQLLAQQSSGKVFSLELKEEPLSSVLKKVE